jgi:excisionase family DNA binding protein
VENVFYTLKEVSEMVKIPIPTLRRHMKKGYLEFSRLGRQIRISKSQLEKYINSKVDEN